MRARADARSLVSYTPLAAFASLGLKDFKTAAVDAITNHVIKLTGNDDALHADYGDKGGHRLRHDDAERAQQLLRDDVNRYK